MGKLLPTVLSALWCIMVFAGTSAAEGGSLLGRIYDAESGQGLVGANVWVVGTSIGAASGLEGRYRVDNIPSGTYDLRVSYVGYRTQTVTGIVLQDDEPVEINVSLATEAVEIDEVVVSAQRIRSASESVLAERKRAGTISDAIAGEQIAKSPDATSGDVLKRVTGLSVVDNKFVFIRGVTDRYNEAAVNGVSVTSTDTDVDKKSFSFDMIPADFVENTVVLKTATPDRPGTLGGGLVEVNTLDFPAKRTLKFSGSSAYNLGTSNKVFRVSPGSSGDWMGMDDGARNLPQGLSGTALAGALPNNWTTGARKAPMSSSFNVSAGDYQKIGSGALGVVGALSYRNGYEANRFVQQSHLPYIDFAGQAYTYSVLWGAILNVHYKPTGRHNFGIETSFDQSAEDEVRSSEGIPESSAPTRRQTIEWDQRSLFVGKLTGEHGLPWIRNSKLDWTVAHTISEALEPDRKNIEYQMGADYSYSMIENYRTWSELLEKSWSFKADLEIPVSRSAVKLGGETLFRNREFDINVYNTDHSKLSWNNFYLTTLPLETIFAAENYGPGKFQFEPITEYTGQYDGKHRLDAYYAMLDLPFSLIGQDLRAVGGARFEKSDQNVTGLTADPTIPFSKARVDKGDVLPSLNMTYAINARTNLRLAYGRSVNRPEFREMADVKYYDFDEFQNVRGNPDLTRATIDSYDARFEIFPGIGEVFAVSYFHKDINDAIEIRLIPEPTRWVRTWFNSPNGVNRGWEVEARKSLGFLGGYMGNVTVTANYTRVESAIEYLDEKTAEDGSHIIRTLTRPMQGQAPWMVNASLLFTEPRLGTDVNILFNKIGRRMSSVGDSRYEDVYKEPRHSLDVSVTQRLKWLQAKISAKDILAEDDVFTMGPRDFREPHSRIEQAPAYSLSLSVGL